MEMPATEEQIRTLAYHLWEEAGSPDAGADEFWIRAQKQLASEPEMGSELQQSEAKNKPANN